MKMLSIFSDIQSSFLVNFEYKNSGEIPRRSVDQGLSTSPKSVTADLLYTYYKRNIQKSQLSFRNFFYMLWRQRSRVKNNLSWQKNCSFCHSCRKICNSCNPVFRRSTMKIPTFSNFLIRLKSLIYPEKLDFIAKFNVLTGHFFIEIFFDILYNNSTT